MTEEIDRAIAEAMKIISDKHRSDFILGDCVNYLGQGLLEVNDIANMSEIKLAIQKIDCRLVITSISTMTEGGLLINFDRCT